MSKQVPVCITFVEGGSLTFMGEPFESGNRTAVFTGQVSLVEIPGKPDGLYTLVAPATVPNEGLLEIQLSPGGDFQGRVRIKVLNDTVVGWVPLTDVYHARRLEFLPAEITDTSVEDPP